MTKSDQARSLTTRPANGAKGMKLDVTEFRHALDIIGHSCGEEAAIAAQFALDLAITARTRAADKPIDAGAAQRLLRLRIARHRAANTPSSRAVH